jgi:hypothetical protein
MRAAYCILALSTASCFADDLSNRVSSLESRMTAIKTQTEKNTVGAQLANASPLYDGYGLFATGDLLFWHLNEEGSEYALSLSEANKGRVKDAHFDWDFGFRLGAGYQMEHDVWEGALNFTWFQTQASDSTSGSLIPEKGYPSSPTATKMESHWNLHYYVLDLSVGRNFFVSKFLSFFPTLGVESGWIAQRRRYEIEQIPSGENIYGKNNYWGIGPRIGVKGTWNFNSHFLLFGSANGCLQWGSFDTHTKETLLTEAGKVKLTHVADHFHRLVPNVQLALGLGWNSSINDDKNYLAVNLSYEFQYWWRQNQFLNEEQLDTTLLQHESQGLSLNGLTLDVRYGF